MQKKVSKEKAKHTLHLGRILGEGFSPREFLLVPKSLVVKLLT
jgi:hypothetical protein